MSRQHCGKLFQVEDIDIGKSNMFIECLDKQTPLDVRQELDK